ncbi:13274_t:CDS:2 [Funneliformis mosseae]|uniref:13274_t:CDS:1 n=1 Tax=Funneliformis mosseae TaxID=27381 RepID=A0A9N9HEB8_FUNMO|nr:13274_t:CDS:2 [Funneliformis mosseae]
MILHQSIAEVLKSLYINQSQKVFYILNWLIFSNSEINTLHVRSSKKIQNEEDNESSISFDNSSEYIDNVEDISYDNILKHINTESIASTKDILYDNVLKYINTESITSAIEKELEVENSNRFDEQMQNYQLSYKLLLNTEKEEFFEDYDLLKEKSSDFKGFDGKYGPYFLILYQQCFLSELPNIRYVGIILNE